MWNSFKDKKNDFAIFKNQPKLVYLDSAATSLTPDSVVAKMNQYYEQYRSNIHRGIYANAEKATAEYEHSRREVAHFIGAANIDEVVFTRGTTESLNIVANGLASQLRSGDEIVLPISEHHSNFVPWQQLALRTGATLKFLDIDTEGHLLFGDYQSAVGVSPATGAGSFSNIVSPQTKVLALASVSNVLGTIHPIQDIVQAARAISPEIIIVLDAAQMVPHMELDVVALDIDFAAFSSHKMFGPTGVGVLWGRKKLLNQLAPLEFGGEMIDEVKTTGTTFKDAPHRFEAGTSPIAEAVALKEALWYITDCGYKNIRSHEKELLQYTLKQFSEHFGQDLKILGPQNPNERVGLIAFSFKDYHPHDIAQILDEQHIAVRAGHHCAQPLHEALGLSASVRASFSVFTTKEDIDLLVAGLLHVEQVLK